MNLEVDREVATSTLHLPPALPLGPMTAQWSGDDTVSPELKDQWIKNGFLVLEGAYSSEEIARYNAIVAKVRREVDDGKDDHGYGDRIGMLHQKEPELLRLAANAEVLSFLRWAFNDDPVLFGSLNFERGTTQDAHIDAIFFWPEPSYSMAGCWIALEDIHPDSGPLFYVPESHTWPFYRSDDVVASRPDLAAKRAAARQADYPPDQRAQLVSELGLAWTQDFRALEGIYETERLPITLKAGDVVFWHSLLAHGGSPRINPALSRRSVVFHYIGKKTKLFTYEQFMLFDRVEMLDQAPQPMNLADFEGKAEYMKYPHFVTYANGEQKTHPV
ncbi:MAG: phytanoyl-CoA dioxygenase family protein [Rhodoplanes sp.]|uniref:phytanoyl-CoA dioxygenase family protein n=1 Tax=Rhodoplanes sp. TaxID=1968906 RepID=UPI0017A1D2A2|nr:phytanoyl-CoA dioxygenase family protein [Rhodoplanes sp.]NVO14886.1 phytanoyl-CoA dioxygenase family protein [Rhodoplanes sp.]